MSGDSFQHRVSLLRETWVERRHLKNLAGAHDLESQFTLLRTLYRWTESAIDDIRVVYGRNLSVTLGPAPVAESSSGFTVTVGDNFTVTFLLVSRQRASASHWYVTVSAGQGGTIVAAGQERRNGQWTRARLEDVLLSLLGAYERSQSKSSRASGNRPFRRIRGA